MFFSQGRKIPVTYEKSTGVSRRWEVNDEVQTGTIFFFLCLILTKFKHVW